MTVQNLTLTPGVITVFQAIRVDEYFEVAGVVLLIYDYCITFSQEIELIWKRDWNYVTYIFWATRYLPFTENAAILLVRQFLNTLTDSQCRCLNITQIWLTVVGLVIGEGISFQMRIECILNVLWQGILILRTYAIWGSKRIAWGLSIFLFLLVFICFVLIIKSITALQYGPSPSPSAFPGCFVTRANRLMGFAILLVTIFETVILFLTVYKVILRKMETGSVSGSTLFQTIYRDGIVFFAYLFLTSLADVIVLNVAEDSIALICTSIYRSLHAILSGRIILNIRAAAFRDIKGANSESIPLSTVVWEKKHQSLQNTVDGVSSGLSSGFSEAPVRSLPSDTEQTISTL